MPVLAGAFKVPKLWIQQVRTDLGADIRAGKGAEACGNSRSHQQPAHSQPQHSLSAPV